MPSEPGIIDDDLINTIHVDAILLDSGNPNLATKVLGGTVRVHNWDLSKRIRESIDIPIFLAGGINKNNVRAAIDHVQPFGIDLCSSVRTNGQLDEKNWKNFSTRYINKNIFYNRQNKHLV